MSDTEQHILNLSENELSDIQTIATAVTELRRNDGIIINEKILLMAMILIINTKPHKGSVVVILNKSDYVGKMNSVIHDETKSERVGPNFR